MRFRFWLTISVLCILIPAMGPLPAACIEEESEGMVIESGEGTPPASVVDHNYAHGCVVVCNYPKGPCGWVCCKSSNHSTSQLCQTARRYASSKCYNCGKTPVTNCYIDYSW